MEWTEVQEQMRARNALASTVLGGLGVLVGLVLLRRPVPRWIALGTIADGGLVAATGRGLLTRLWTTVTKRNIRKIPGKTPALKEV